MGEVDQRMLIDSFAPIPDAVETHRILIAAPPEVVYRALWTSDFGGSPIIRSLLALRSLPGFVSRGCQPLPRSQNLTLRTLIEAGFGVLAEKPNEEIVLGVTGKFWRASGNLFPFNREDFEKPVASGFARAVWNFRVSDNHNGATILSTETRVICGDLASRKKFCAYWTFVRPFSGLIRRLMLRELRKAVNTGH